MGVGATARVSARLGAAGQSNTMTPNVLFPTSEQLKHRAATEGPDGLEERRSPLTSVLFDKFSLCCESWRTNRRLWTHTQTRPDVFFNFAREKVGVVACRPAALAALAKQKGKKTGTRLSAWLTESQTKHLPESQL